MINIASTFKKARAKGFIVMVCCFLFLFSNRGLTQISITGSVLEQSHEISLSNNKDLLIDAETQSIMLNPWNSSQQALNYIDLNSTFRKTRKKSGNNKGALIGGGIGLLTGVAIGASIGPVDVGVFETQRVNLTGLLGTSGALIGLIVGSKAKKKNTGESKGLNPP